MTTTRPMPREDPPKTKKTNTITMKTKDSPNKGENKKIAEPSLPKGETMDGNIINEVANTVKLTNNKKIYKEALIQGSSTTNLKTTITAQKMTESKNEQVDHVNGMETITNECCR